MRWPSIYLDGPRRWCSFGIWRWHVVVKKPAHDWRNELLFSERYRKHPCFWFGQWHVSIWTR